MSSSRDEHGRQKLPDRETTGTSKQVKPVGTVQSAELFPVRDNGKSEVGTWEAVFERENLWTALKRVESNRGATGVDGMEVQELRSYLKAHWLEVREALESGRYRPSPVRRGEAVGHPSCVGSIYPTGHCTSVGTDVRGGVLTA